MSTQPYDPVQYKAQQRQQWDAVAGGWRKWWRKFEQGAQHVSDQLVELAEIRSGHRVLDVATGIGEPAITAARRGGSTGRVVAIDASPQMLAIARERAAELGLQNVEFLEADAESFDFPESSFDAVICRWGLMFLTDLDTALGRIWRVLAPGGRIAAAIWGKAEQVPLLSVARRIAEKVFELPPPPAGIPSPFGLAENVLERALSRIGFTDVYAETLAVKFEFSSADEFTEYVRDVNGTIAALLIKQPVQKQAEFQRALVAAAREYVQSDGSVRIPNTAICVAGRRQ